MSTIINYINTIGIEADDNEIIINQKRIVVYEAILMSFGGVVWGVLAIFLDRTIQSSIPLGYVVLSFINISLLKKFSWFKISQTFQTTISLLLPFFFQWSLGGFYSSGGVMLWALLALAVSLSYSNTKTSVFWLFLYVFFTIFSGIYDSTFQKLFPYNVDVLLSIQLVTLNVSFVSILIFLLVIFYVKENTKAYAEVQNAQQMVIQSEKLAALGQLSAGIAHEINTPLGAIKAIAEQSSNSSTQLYAGLTQVLNNLTDNELHLMNDFIRNYNVTEVFLTTREERKMTEKLAKELDELKVLNSRNLAQKLIRIDIFEIPPFFRKIEKSHIKPVIELLHSIFIMDKNNNTTFTSVEKASRVVKALKMYLHSSTTHEAEFFNLRESLDTVLTIYHNQLKHGVQVNLNVADNIKVKGYVEEISQVWTNLIVNACQAMNFNGLLNIKTLKRDNFVVISIEDTGCGIPDEVGNKIFDAFYSTKKIGEGSGIGLDIVKKIVEKHQGKIYFNSSSDIGTTFFVELPLDP